MNILITGGSGQLGRELLRKIQIWGLEVLAPSHQQLDITDIEHVKEFFNRHQPSCVVNTAAYTQVDHAEVDESLAFAVNKNGCTNLAQLCESSQVPLIQVSTDYVFDGQKREPYLESDPISPIGIYGKSKAAGEEEIRAKLKMHIILRTSWLYGFYGQNFVKTMLKLAATQETIRVVSDQYGCPTSAAALAEVILTIADRWHQQSEIAWGTYHYCGHGIISWHEFAEAIIQLSQRYGKIKATRVVPITTADFATKARRPAFSALDCNLIKKNFGISPKPWRKSLESTIQRLLKTTAAGDGTLPENSLS